ncbi:MAG TPA: type II toxin-antitoxin system RelE/ParE family toxin [Sedimentisphaerales bacterium]|jgi:addiction module RelE/StbE family toxin|nr:type II toxin-antitoxin system RelE/ParE family toxin [Sedimentisphaerales bacterium]HNU30831.1 type II toxin-antitoxin system RelE/ParE family toxin [Sedimentisphaerales bacterium]
MAEVIWTIKAIEQVEQIGLFIERDSPFQARRVVQLIIREARRLREHARIGKMIPELEEDRYRELRIFSYRVLYKIMDEDQIAIVGVVHGRRLFDPRWLP